MALAPLRIVHASPNPYDEMAERFYPEIGRFMGLTNPVELQPAEQTHHLAESCAVVAMGSPLMMNTPETAWSATLSEALVDAAQEGVPVFGICFSHQMLAHHLGGRIASWDKVKEAILDVTFADEGPFTGIGTAPVALTHRDHVIALGPDCIPLGHGGFGGIQAMRHRDLPIWTMQGHPEMTDGMLSWVEQHERNRNFAGYPPEARNDPTGKHILASFGRIVRQTGTAVGS